MDDQMSDQALARLQDRVLDMACNTFGLSADAGAELVFEAQAEIERNERFVNSPAAIDRAVYRVRRQLLARQDALRRAR